VSHYGCDLAPPVEASAPDGKILAYDR